MRPMFPRIVWMATLVALAACEKKDTPAEARAKLEARMKTPCLYVGEWRATRPGADYWITLTAKGRFIAEPNGPGVRMTGRWGVVDNEKIVWIYDMGGTRPPEVNDIVTVSDDVFDMVEVDKSQTHYVRQAKGECVG